MWLMALFGGLTGCVPYGLEKVEIEMGDDTRQAFVAIPDSLEDGSPLMLSFHGGGIAGLVKGTQMARVTAFNEIGQDEGFVTAFPTADGGSWSDSTSSGADDIGFVRKLVDTLVSDYGVDAERVYASGLSNGGFFSMRLACEASDLVAAVASVSGGLLEGYECVGGEPVAVMLVAQTQDKVVPMDGGTVAYVTDVEARPHEEVVQEQVKLMSCDEEPYRDARGEAAEDGTFISERRWRNCLSAVEVVSITVHGGGHQWPGGDSVGIKGLSGTVAEALDASQAVWDFASVYER